MEYIYLNLPEDLKNKLDEEVKKSGLTLYTFINEILIKHIKEVEDENANKK